MAVYQLLALLLSLTVWQRLFRHCRLGLLVLLDSEFALRVVIKLAHHTLCSTGLPPSSHYAWRTFKPRRRPGNTGGTPSILRRTPYPDFRRERKSITGSSIYLENTHLLLFSAFS